MSIETKTAATPPPKTAHPHMVGGMCWRCWKTEWEIENASDGGTCSESNTKWGSPERSADE